MTLSPPPLQDESALFGFWYGTDLDDKPTIGPFILVNRTADDDSLPHQSVAAITRFGMLRVSTNHVDRSTVDLIIDDHRDDDGTD